MKPHKHADLIKAWADGARIEARYLKGHGWTEWAEETGGFIWYEGGAEYRIKPEPRRIKDTYIANILLKLTIEQDGPMLTFTNVELMK